MFGMMEALLGFVRRQMGLRSDAPSASGSVHAKLANITNKIGTTSDTRASNTLFGWSNSTIKSIQTGVTDMSTNTTSTTNVTISSVVPEKSIVILNCEFGTANDISTFAKAQGSAALTSSTNLRLTRALGKTGSDGAGMTTRFRWQVIEFY
jgi:hypothetical protein